MAGRDPSSMVALPLAVADRPGVVIGGYKNQASVSGIK
jgi:hypothetical protein